MRSWFERHHQSASEVLAAFYKKSSGEPSVTWPEAVDVALCFGWIDGVRKNVDATRYTIRFTPRRPRSIWSAVNIRRVPELTELGLMRPEGLRAYEARIEKRSKIYSYEQKDAPVISEEYLYTFRSNGKAWEFFEAQAPWYRRTLSWWVMSAKKEETRLKRLATLIENSEKHRRLR